MNVMTSNSNLIQCVDRDELFDWASTPTLYLNNYLENKNIRFNSVVNLENAFERHTFKAYFF